VFGAAIRACEQSIFPVERNHSSILPPIGQDVEVFYRWHAFYGRRVRPSRLEPRANGQIAFLEASPSEILIVSVWMLDQVSAGM
jgi:hypothetical protein